MFIHACLWSLIAAAPPDQVIVPKLERGLELVYRGTFAEELDRPGVRARHEYDFETRLFVLDTFGRGADVAVLTVVRRHDDNNHAAPEPPAAVRLELARVDVQGRLSLLAPNSLNDPPQKRGFGAKPFPPVPLDGPPVPEAGVFLAPPQGRLGEGTAWDAVETGRPPRAWKVVAVEPARGVRCFKVSGVQQSDDWARPRPGGVSWRREDTVWLSPLYGYASRVERVTERRDLSGGDGSTRSRLTFELAGRLNYSGQFYQDRREEVAQARLLAAELEVLLPEAGRSGPRPFDALLNRVDQHIARHPDGESLPYREVLRLVQRRAEGARRGDTPPPPLPKEQVAVGGKLAVGRPPADCVFPSLTGESAVRLQRLQGRPVVLIYFRPGAPTSGPLLRFAAEASARYGARAHFLALAADDPAAALKQRAELRLKLPLWDGRDAKRLHAIDGTPRIVVLDPSGTVRKLIPGWGDEADDIVRRELELWIRP